MARHPNPIQTSPGHGPPALAVPRRSTEAEIQRAVIQHLSWRGAHNLWFAHYPSGGLRNRIVAAQLKGAGTKPGVPDLLIVAHGRLYGLELKADRGRLSQSQIATHAEMRAAGATIGVATGIDEALELLGTWGLLRG